MPTGQVKLGVKFAKTREEPKFVANGDLKLFINDKVVAAATMRTQPGRFGVSGGIAVGRNPGDPVSKEFQSPYRFTGGRIKQVTINISGEHVVDLEKEAARMLARE